MTTQLRNLPWALAGLIFLAGCNAKENSGQGKPSASQRLLDPADVIKQLQAVDAELQRNADGNVSHVTLKGAAVSEPLLESLTSLAQLQNLAIAEADLTLPLCEKIGKVKALRQLDLRECKLGNAELTAAVGSLSELQALRLSGKNGATTVDDAGMVALKNCPHLKVLAADFLWIGDKGLAELKGLKELRELYLANSLVDDAALGEIASMPGVKKIRLSKTNVTREGLEKLTALKLEELDISECVSVEDAALEPVGKMLSLKKLNLWRDVVGDEGAKHLAGLENLEWLNVDNTQMSDASLASFVKFKKLKFLHLGSTPVTDAGMVHLMGLTALADLKVTRTAVTEEGVVELGKAIPKLKIQLKYGKEE